MSLALPAVRRDLTARRLVAGCVAVLGRQIDHDAAFGRFQLWLPALAVAGVMLAVEAPFTPPLLPLAALTVLGLAGWIVLGRSRFALAAPVALALAALVAGGTAVTLQEELVGTPFVARAMTTPVEGRILSVERTGPGMQRIVVALTAAEVSPLPRKVRLSVRGAASLSAGDTVAATARLFPPPGPVLPNGYDPSRRLYFDGVGATGFTYGAPVSTPATPGPFAAIERVRAAIEGRIVAALPDANAGFAAALIVGARGTIPDEDVDALRISGLAHILAISGLHMVLVAGTVFAAVRFFLASVPGVALRYPIKKWAAIVGLLAATMYLALSGASVATVRAYIMLAIALLAILADRPALTMRTVAIAAAAIIAVDPISVVEPGFQMSFLAVIALVGTYEWWGGRRTLRRGPLRPALAFVLGLASSSLIAGLATTLIGVFHFGRVAPLSLVANLAALPIVSWVTMPAGILSLLLMPFGLEAAPLAVMGASLTLVLAIAHQVADWTGGSAVVGAIPAATALLSTLGLLWLALFLAPWRLVGIALIALGLALSPLAQRWDVLVAEDAALVAARGPDGRLSLVGTDDFTAYAWLVADGDARAPAEATTGLCDRLGCALPGPVGIVAVARSPRAAADDCRRAAFRVTADTAPLCAVPAIDRHTLGAGAVAARYGPAGWTIVPARGAGRAWQQGGAR